MATYVWRRYQLLVIVLSFAFFFQSCNNEDPIPLDPVWGVLAADNGNAGNGSDLEVFVSEQLDNNHIAEYRAFIIKSDRGGYSLEEANSNEYYESATPEEIFPIQGIVFTENSRDTDGDLLQNDVDYVVGVLSIARNPEDWSNSFFLSDQHFRLTVNNQISDFTREFEAGAGSLTLNAEGDIIMGDYNIISELSDDKSENFTVYRIDGEGSVRTLDGSFRMLGGNTTDIHGNVYQSILNYARVIKIGSDGNRETIVLNNFDVRGNDGIHVNSEQEMFVVNPESGTILKWDLTTGENGVFARVNMSPRGITGDESGNLYISHNHQDGVISKVSKEGVVSELARVPTFIPEFYTVSYLMWVGYLTYHEGDLYVAGMSTDRIYKVGLDGQVEVFVGSGERGIPRGGALTANLNRPIGLAFSEDGNTLYISGSTDNVPQHTQASTPVKVWQVSLVE